MTTPTSGCASATPALRAALDAPIASFAAGTGKDALTRAGATPDALAAIGRDPSCPNPMRFAAFEGWIALAGEHALGQVDDATATAMATVQAEAIRTADEASLWGLPPSVSSEPLSRHLIILGKRALPPLKPLLDDTRPLPIAGSETSAIAGLRRYRISDLAAGLCAVILGQPYQDAKAPADRDKQIAALRAAI